MISGDWHLDKKFGVVVIISMFTQAGSIVWYGSKAESRISTLEARPDLTERVIKLEALSGEHGRILNRINGTLDKMDVTMDKFGKEQAKRTPAISKIYEHEKSYHRN